MTHNCICTVVAMTRRRPSLDLSNEQCIVDINYWMSANWLKLNMDKTELLWAGTRRFLSMGDGSFPSLQLGGAIIAPSQHVRVLGVMFFFRLTSVPRSMFPTSARPASTICVDYGTSGAH